MDEKKTSEGQNIRELSSSGLVGFDSLPHQIVKRRIQDGFIFNILLIGETGIGKSTLMCSLFNIPMEQPSGSHSNLEVQLQSKLHSLQEKGVNLRLTVVETIGYGDQIDRNENIKPIIDYIELQFEKYLNEEVKAKRSLALYRDTRVHACLYFIAPTGHSVKSVDLFCMRELQEKVNIIPIVAKSDSLSKVELHRFKNTVKNKLEGENIKIYKFPIDDEAVAVANSNSNESIPFAIAASQDYIHIDDKVVRARVFPWGIMFVEDEKHSEFLTLKDMLIMTNMEDIREKTHTQHYEYYRRNRLEQLGYPGFENISFSFEEMYKKRRRDLQQEMLGKEEILKKIFVEKVKAKNLEFDELEKAMHSKYNNMFEELRLENESIKNMKIALELEILSFKRNANVK